MAKYIKTEDGYQEIEEIVDNKVDSKMDKNNPVGTGSFSMGRKAGSVVGSYSHTEGFETTASESYSHAEGSSTTASGGASHAEGYITRASGPYSHAEGSSTRASGSSSHAEGYYVTASGNYSHAEGSITTAKGYASHAEGSSTIASGVNSHVQGRYNKEDNNNEYAHIVGNGDSGSSRSNAHTVDWSGNAWFAGVVKVGGTGQDDASSRGLAILDENGKIPESQLNVILQDDVLDLLSESGIISMAFALESEVYTDESGKIYLL